MFSAQTYQARRERLIQDVGQGVILLLGNQESSMNFAHNLYPFRQDSSFLYFVGLDEPDLSVVLDVEEGTVCLYGDDVTVEQLVWTGALPTMASKAEQVGIDQIASSKNLATHLQDVQKQGRPIHVLPAYRPDQRETLAQILGQVPTASVELIKAVVAQRSYKSDEEIEEIESALHMSYRMFTTAMQVTGPGKIEREVVGFVEGMVGSQGLRMAFPVIYSVRGEILHNPDHHRLMQAGDMVVFDAGSESEGRYASDITRTIPVCGHFTPQQREIYQIVLSSQQKAIDGLAPGVEFRELHRLAAREIVSGLKDLGLLKGDVDEAVAADVHTLFFPCGLGHMMGLDVHDMEALGEEYVGYTDTLKKNPAFGWRSLRLGKALEPGFVVTVEPGIYFIGDLIDQWAAEHQNEAFINYPALDAYRKLGGVRLEDDFLMTEQGARLLGKPIPKALAEVEDICHRG